MQKPLLNAKKADGDGRKEGQMEGQTDGQMDGWPAGRTDGWMDGHNGQMEKLRNGTTDIAGYKVACTRLKMRFNPETRSTNLSRVVIKVIKVIKLFISTNIFL